MFRLLHAGVADPVDASGCTLVAADFASCTPENVTAGATDMFNFFFTVCRSPTVTAIQFTDALSSVTRSGTSSTVLTVTGTGFSTNDCSNIVKIGDCECTVADSTETSLTCTPDASCEYDAGVFQLVTVNVNQLGNAVLDIASVSSQSIAFVPMVSSLTPNSGSTKGKTTVVIDGSGFPSLDEVSVKFNGYSAECSSISPLTCVSPVSTTGEVTVTVNGFSSVCTGSCIFSYDVSITPTVTDVSPTTVNDSTLLTFTGTGFGTTSADVTITVGGAVCTPVTVSSDTTATCTVAAIPAGNRAIDLVVDGIGSASTSKTVSGIADVSAVLPTSGSVNGGTVLTFTGHGFAGTSQVTSGGVEICTDVEVVSLTELTCTTLANATGHVALVIVSSGETYPAISYEYADDDTPTIASVSPSSGGADDSITITGTNFGADASALNVTIGGVECTSASFSGSDITCTAGVKSTGTYAVQVLVDGQGLSNDNIIFEYAIVVSGISPASGDSLGYQALTVSGSGLSSSLTVTVCGNDCMVESASASNIVCATPAKDGTYCVLNTTVLNKLNYFHNFKDKIQMSSVAFALLILDIV